MLVSFIGGLLCGFAMTISGLLLWARIAEPQEDDPHGKPYFDGNILEPKVRDALNSVEGYAPIRKAETIHDGVGKP